MLGMSKGRGKALPIHPVKAYGGSGDIAPLISNHGTSALGGGE